MYQLNELDLWREHRKGLLREAEGERISRQLRAARPKRADWFRNALFGQVRAVGSLRAEDSHCA